MVKVPVYDSCCTDWCTSRCTDWCDISCVIST